MKLAAIVLEPAHSPRTTLTADGLYDLIMRFRLTSDALEHVRVVQYDDHFRIGAYFAVADPDEAQVRLRAICHRILGDITGWRLNTGA